MWDLASRLLIVAGKGQAAYELNSFDYALLDAGIANYNHSIQSSIIPPGARLIERITVKTLPLEGSILPTIMSRKHGIKGDVITAALAFGINQDSVLPGLVYEHSGRLESDVRMQVENMLSDAAKKRNWMLKEIIVKSISFTVIEAHGCAFVGGVLLP